jgi:hypothetical protein
MANFFTYLSAQSNGADIAVRPLTPPLFAPLDAFASAQDEMTPRYRSRAPLVYVAPTLLDLANTLEPSTDQELPRELVTARAQQHLLPTALLRSIASRAALVQQQDKLPVFPTTETATQQLESTPPTMHKPDQAHREQSPAILPDAETDILPVSAQEKRSSHAEALSLARTQNEQDTHEVPARAAHTQAPQQSPDKLITHKPEQRPDATVHNQLERTPITNQNIEETHPIDNAVSVTPTTTKTSLPVAMTATPPYNRAPINPVVIPNKDDESGVTLSHSTAIIPAFEKSDTTLHSRSAESTTVTDLTGGQPTVQHENIRKQYSVRREVEEHTSVTWPLIMPLVEAEMPTSTASQTGNDTDEPAKARVTRSSTRKQWMVRTQQTRSKQAMQEGGQTINTETKGIEQQAPPLLIQVRIGRVEVRTTPPTPRPAPRSFTIARPTLTLSEYLQQRKRELQ